MQPKISKGFKYQRKIVVVLLSRNESQVKPTQIQGEGTTQDWEG